MRALLTTFGQMERDLAQVTNPKFLGLSQSPVIVSIADGATLLQLARIAPATTDRPTEVQTVYYRVVDGTLTRQATAALPGFQTIADRPAGVGPAADQRAPDVGAHLVTERRLGRPQRAAGPGGGAAAAVNAVPAGVEVTIERDNGQTFRRVLLVGA